MTFGPRFKFSLPLSLTILAALSTNLAAAAQDLSRFQKILIPVHNSKAIAGANNATFKTSLDLLSSNLQPVRFYPAASASRMPVVGQTEPQLLALLIWEAPVVAHGRFVFIDQSAADDPIAAAVNDSPLPVIRERDVLKGKSTFMTLPVDGGFLQERFPATRRFTLRIYDWDSTGGLRVVVRLRWGNWLIRGVIGETTVDVSSRDAADPSYPYYAELTLDQHLFANWCFPTLRSQCAGFPGIIEVESSPWIAPLATMRSLA